MDIVNDSATERIVDQCDAKCTQLHDHADLKPGDVMPQNASDANVPAWYVVTTTDGKRVGCLLLQFTHKQPNARVGLSHMRACPAEIFH